MSKASPDSSAQSAATFGILGIQGRMPSSQQFRLLQVKWELCLSSHLLVCWAFIPFKRKDAVDTEQEMNTCTQLFVKAPCFLVGWCVFFFFFVCLFFLAISLCYWNFTTLEAHFKPKANSDPEPQSNPRCSTILYLRASSSYPPNLPC